MRRAKSFKTEEITQYAKTSLTPGSQVFSDGLACFKTVTDANFEHYVIVTGGGKSCVKIDAFRWVNTVLGNVKNLLTGTYRAIRKNHASRYLAEFEHRFNRRFDLSIILESIVICGCKNTSHTMWNFKDS